jgi:ADP-ribose pyrophosphatase YjhB (NUDIX family)
VVLREWTVASGLIERDGELLLVRNVRRNGIEDWSTPGGVVDADDASLLAALTREVAEETGLVVREWVGPVYEVVAEAPGLGWRLRCEVHLAVAYEGEIVIDDPDGIVVEASYCVASDAHDRLASCPQWVREPLAEWLLQRWELEAGMPHRRFEYDVIGTGRHDMRVERR